MQAPASGPAAGGCSVVVVVVAVVAVAVAVAVVAVVAAWSLSAVLGQEWSQTWRWVVVERACDGGCAWQDQFQAEAKHTRFGTTTRAVLEKDGTVNRPWVGSLGRMGRTDFQKAARKGGGREGNIRWKIRRGEEGWAR